jgi:uridylate kinase
MKTLLIKISGEFFSNNKVSISENQALQIAKEIKSLRDKKVNVAVVVGAGNIVRGAHLKSIDRVVADYAGMTAALSNGLILHGALKFLGIDSVIDSTLNVSQTGYYFRPERARSDVASGQVVIFGGTGLPYMTTDTAAVVFALSIKADELIKLTKVNGVFEKDPVRFPKARRFTKLTYDQVLAANLRVMDMSAFALARENNLPIRVAKWSKGCLLKILQQADYGTAITK